MRYRVEARPIAGRLVLYLTRKFRLEHDGHFTTQFAGRLTWRRESTAQKAIETEKLRGVNKAHGTLSYSVVPEDED